MSKMQVEFSYNGSDLDYARACQGGCRFDDEWHRLAPSSDATSERKILCFTEAISAEQLALWLSDLYVKGFNPAAVSIRVSAERPIMNVINHYLALLVFGLVPLEGLTSQRDEFNHDSALIKKNFDEAQALLAAHLSYPLERWCQTFITDMLGELPLDEKRSALRAWRVLHLHGWLRGEQGRENAYALFLAPDPLHRLELLFILQSLGYLNEYPTQQTLASIITAPNPYDAWLELSRCERIGLSPKTYKQLDFSILWSHKNPGLVYSILRSLHDHHCLESALEHKVFHQIFTASEPYLAAFFWEDIARNAWIAPDLKADYFMQNVQRLLRHPDVFVILCMVRDSNLQFLFNGSEGQSNLDLLLDAPLDRLEALRRIPAAELTQTRFNEILKSYEFQEPTHASSIYVNPKTKTLHCLLPLMRGENIGLDNTCKTSVALQTFFSQDHLQHLEAYQTALTWDVSMIVVESPLKREKKQRLDELTQYIEALRVLRQKPSLATLLRQGLAPYPEPIINLLQSSNLYSVLLRPQHIHRWTSDLEPVFSLQREGESVFYNQCDTIYPETIKPLSPRAALIQNTRARLEGRTDFNSIQAALTAQVEISYGQTMDFYNRSGQNTPITQDDLDRMIRGESDLALSVEDYIETLLNYCASDRDFSDRSSVFNTFKNKEELLIMTQFFMADVNIYCQSQGLSLANFGVILDGSSRLSEDCAQTIMRALCDPSLSVEPVLCEWINQHASELLLDRALSSEDIHQITVDFTSHFQQIRDIPHYDQFVILDRIHRGKILIHRNMMCTDLAFLMQQFHQQASFVAHCLQDYADCPAPSNELAADNSCINVAWLLDTLEQQIGAIQAGYPLGFVCAKLSSNEQLTLLNTLESEILDLIQTPAQLRVVLIALSVPGKQKLATLLHDNQQALVARGDGDFVTRVAPYLARISGSEEHVGPLDARDVSSDFVSHGGARPTGLA